MSPVGMSLVVATGPAGPIGNRFVRCKRQLRPRRRESLPLIRSWMGSSVRPSPFVLLPENAPQEVLPDMVEFMANLRKEITIGVVGGSDLPKQKEQLGETGALLLLCGLSCSGVLRVDFPTTASLSVLPQPGTSLRYVSVL